jgi:hypothetical protein
LAIDGAIGKHFELLETAITAVEGLKGLAHIEKSKGQTGIATECFERFALALVGNGTWEELSSVLTRYGAYPNKGENEWKR